MFIIYIFLKQDKRLAKHSNVNSWVWSSASIDASLAWQAIVISDDLLSAHEMLLQTLTRMPNYQNLSNQLPIPKGQLNSEWIYEVIVSPKMPTKKLKDFCPGSLLGQKSFKFLQVTSLPCFLGASWGLPEGFLIYTISKQISRKTPGRPQEDSRKPKEA